MASFDKFFSSVEVLLLDIFAARVVRRRIGRCRICSIQRSNMHVVDTGTKGGNIECVVGIDMVDSIDIAGIKRHHITVVPSQRIGGRSYGLENERTVVHNSVVLIHIGIARHKERRQRLVYGIVEASVVGSHLVDPDGNVEVDRCRSHGEVGNLTKGIRYGGRSADASSQCIRASLQRDGLTAVLRMAFNTIVQYKLATGIGSAVVDRDSDRLQTHTAAVVECQLVDSHIHIGQVDKMDTNRSRIAKAAVVVVAYKFFVGGAKSHSMTVVGNLPKQRRGR